jgi:hypothetical protein
MVRRIRTAGAALGATLLLGIGGFADAAEVYVGGYLDQGLRAAQQTLIGGPADAGLADGIQMGVVAPPAGALTAFTPRFGGLGLAGRSMTRNQLAAPTAAPQRVSIGIGDSTEIAGVAVGLKARATMPSGEAGLGAPGSGLVVGGELAVSGVRFDAVYGEDAALLGFEPGSRVTAGVAYGLGPVDARMSYSLIETERQADKSSLVTVGSRLQLQPGFAVQGDVAYSESGRGDPTTAGLVSLRLNF